MNAETRRRKILEHLSRSAAPVSATVLADGAMIRSVVLFAVLIYELFGPAMTKRALTAAGDIKPDGKTSARKPNQGKPLFHLHHK